MLFDEGVCVCVCAYAHHVPIVIATIVGALAYTCVCIHHIINFE